MSALSPEERERYARHILLKEIGGPGQQRLKASTIAIVGLGGLGAPAALYLAAAGVGRLRLIDDDAVALSNLQRQVLYRSDEMGAPKAARAAAALRALNPHVEIEIVRERLTEENTHALLSGADIVLDGTDSFATRFAVNAACHELGIALISGAVGRWEGQVATFKSGLTKHLPPAERLPCYRCLVPEAPPNAETCAAVGIVGALTGVIGSLMALEAIKEIAGAGESLAGRLLLYDGLTAQSRTVALKRDPGCVGCGIDHELERMSPRHDLPTLLIAAARRDVETRARLAADGALFQGYHPEMEAVHLENAALLEAAIEALGGWPVRSRFGDEVASAAFLIAQHAISAPALQRRALALLVDAAASGDANILDTAYLSDRIAVFEGRPQLFGTQFDWDERGLLSPAPCAEPQALDERRASVGLPSMAETIATMRANAAAEGERAPPDLAQRRAEFEAWARRVGWRS